MTTPTTENNAVSDPEALSEPDPGTDTGNPVEAGSEATSPVPDTFPREYVEQLRRENAEARVAAKKSDALAQRLVTSLAAGTGRLADPSDLPYSVALLDDDGLPDAEKVTAAVDELLARKPHLASTRPVGDVGQGARGAVAPMVSLAELLRAGAG
jgi:hypothetical protein